MPWLRAAPLTEEEPRIPITGIFAGCCAWAGETVVSKTVVSNQIRILPLIVLAPAFFLNTDN
jgi:hypothetical protein